ncbi:MAG: FAD-dependent oxidoreductase [Synergistaceae bacterium]|nr:FAD-dependent oxidoreductase [Synergistaceae bacterium]
MKKFLLSLIIFLSLQQAHEAPALQSAYDVIVAGAGTGGISAAIQAARLGAEVLVIESTSMLGGQATSAGVSTMDDLSGQMSGLYAEFISRVEEYYSLRGKSTGTCYWNTIYKAFEPSVGSKILAEMARGEDAPDILYNSHITGVQTEKVIAVDGDNVNENICVKGVIVHTPEGRINIPCKILIDATEYGDIIPMTGARYRAANSLSDNLNPDALIQDITWTAIIRKYPGGVPARLRPSSPLPGYDMAKYNYESYVISNGADFKGTYPVKLPVNFISHNAYRGLPDSFLPGNYDSEPENWKLITKCSVNWGNDYPGQYTWRGKYGLPVSYLEDKKLRERIERDAMIKTLHFIYYIQNELHEDWSIDEDEYNSLPEAAKDLPKEWQEIARHMPPIPYVRESRRIVASHTLTSTELYENSLSYQGKNKNREINNSIAIGCYILDLHHLESDSELEQDLGEKAEFMDLHKPAGNFQVPLDILIPEKVDGFIAAEKNLSMTRLVSGALRLQPITMMTGQAAGTLAALAVKQEVQPRFVKPVRVQRALLDSGVNLSLCEYSDVPQGHKYNASVQLMNLYDLIQPEKYPEMTSHDISMSVSLSDGSSAKGIFGVDEPLTPEQSAKIIERLNAITGRKVEVKEFEETDGLTKGEAADITAKLLEQL